MITEVVTTINRTDGEMCACCGATVERTFARSSDIYAGVSPLYVCPVCYEDDLDEMDMQLFREHIQEENDNRRMAAGF